MTSQQQQLPNQTIYPNDVQISGTINSSVLFIPGVGGSILNIKIKEKNGKETEQQIWPCLIDKGNLVQRYLTGLINPETLELVPFEDNVKIYANDKDFGLYAIDYLVPDLPLPHDLRAEFHDLIEMFQQNGYQPGTSLWGYPYDWRQDISLACIQEPLRQRIIQAYNSCGQQKISIISHSQGGLVFKIFAALHPDDVQRYVKRWVTIGSPFQGSPVVMCGIIFGYNFHLPAFMLQPKVFLQVLRISPLAFWYFPPKSFPYSPKVGVKFERSTEIKWYGFHSDNEQKCWDYDSVNRNERIVNENEQNQTDQDNSPIQCDICHKLVPFCKYNQHIDMHQQKHNLKGKINVQVKQKENDIMKGQQYKLDQKNKVDEEYELLSGIIDGRVKIQQFVINQTHFSEKVLTQYEQANPYVNQQGNMKNADEARKRNLFSQLKQTSKMYYEQCQCGLSYGCICNKQIISYSASNKQMSSSSNLLYTQRFDPQFFENLDKINKLQNSPQKIQKLYQPFKIPLQPQQQTQSLSQQLQIKQQSLSQIESQFSSQFMHILPPHSSYPHKYIDQQQNSNNNKLSNDNLNSNSEQQILTQMTPFEYLSLPMFDPSPLHSLYKPGFPLAGYKQNKYLDQRKIYQIQKGKFESKDDEQIIQQRQKTNNDFEGKNKENKENYDDYDKQIEKLQNKPFYVPQSVNVAQQQQITQFKIPQANLIAQQQIQQSKIPQEQRKAPFRIQDTTESTTAVNSCKDTIFEINEKAKLIPKQSIVQNKQRSRVNIDSIKEIDKQSQLLQRKQTENGKSKEKEKDNNKIEIKRNNQQINSILQDQQQSKTSQVTTNSKLLEVPKQKTNSRSVSVPLSIQKSKLFMLSHQIVQQLPVSQLSDRSQSQANRDNTVLNSTMVQSDYFHDHEYIKIDLPIYDEDKEQQYNQQQIINEDDEEDDIINPIQFNTADILLDIVKEGAQIIIPLLLNPKSTAFKMAIRSRQTEIPCIQYHISNNIFRPPHNNQNSFFELIREIQYWQNEIINKMSETSTKIKSAVVSMLSLSSTERLKTGQYIPSSQGGRNLLWENPSLEKLQSHVEEIRSLPILFPPEFQFINIFGSGTPTIQNLVLFDTFNGENPDKHKFRISSIQHLAEYCDYMSQGQPEIKTRQRIEYNINSQSSQSSDYIHYDQSSIQNLPLKQQKLFKLNSDIYPMWTVVDGDGTVPCYSSAADGLKADARFEIRQSEHVKLLFDPRVLNIIAAIFGLWKQEDKEKINSFQTFKCQYLTELERIIQQAQNSD